MRLRTSASLATAVAAAAVFLAGRAPAPAPPMPAAPAPPNPVQLPPARGVPLAPLARSSPPADTVLGRSPGPERRPPSSTERLLASWSADELALFARVELLTGRAPSPEVLALVRQRRAGATTDVLRAEAARLLAGDPLARAAALEWARAGARP